MKNGRGRRLISLLPWIPVVSAAFFLFRFTPPYRAILLLLALAVHEGGHVAAFLFFGEGVPRLFPDAGGFRLRAPSPLSYRGECLVALAGPAANLIPGILLLFLSALSPYFFEVGWIFCGTGLSNLIPIADHDGGRAVRCLLSSRFPPEKADAIAFAASLVSLSVSLTLSLSLLYVVGGGFYFTVFCLFSLLSHPLPDGNFF